MVPRGCEADAMRHKSPPRIEQLLLAPRAQLELPRERRHALVVFGAGDLAESHRRDHAA
jgi:hypothetical protein